SPRTSPASGPARVRASSRSSATTSRASPPVSPRATSSIATGATSPPRTRLSCRGAALSRVFPPHHVRRRRVLLLRRCPALDVRDPLARPRRRSRRRLDRLLRASARRDGHGFELELDLDL